MKAHVLQHVPFEDIGQIGTWLDSREAAVSYTRFFRNDRLPELNGMDLLVVMGGPMSVNDEDIYPWLGQEKAFIRETIRRGIPTIGICLGAQLIASALEVRVYRNPHKEIGWFPVTAIPNEESSFHFPNSFSAFHWHGETFDLPPGSIHLARSRACENQAFQIGRRTFGLQFHLETTPESLNALVDNCGEDLTDGEFIQTREQMTRVDRSAFSRIHAVMNDLLVYATF
jgi:GMP synthase-like glutamine amidotransferase